MNQQGRILDEEEYYAGLLPRSFMPESGYEYMAGVSGWPRPITPGLLPPSGPPGGGGGPIPPPSGGGGPIPPPGGGGGGPIPPPGGGGGTDEVNIPPPDDPQGNYITKKKGSDWMVHRGWVPEIPHGPETNQFTLTNVNIPPEVIDRITTTGIADPRDDVGTEYGMSYTPMGNYVFPWGLSGQGMDYYLFQPPGSDVIYTQNEDGSGTYDYDNRDRVLEKFFTSYQPHDEPFRVYQNTTPYKEGWFYGNNLLPESYRHYIQEYDPLIHPPMSSIKGSYSAPYEYGYIPAEYGLLEPTRSEEQGPLFYSGTHSGGAWGEEPQLIEHPINLANDPMVQPGYSLIGLLPDPTYDIVGGGVIDPGPITDSPHG